MSSINFDNPYLLLIAVPLIVLFSVPFFIAVRKDNRNGHNVTSQILHVVMALLIGFAAAGTKITTVLTETEVYVVADVSYSANKNLDKLDNYIKNIELPRNSEVGLVCFGKDYQLVSELGRQSRLKSVREAEVDDTETNIAQALEYTGTLFGGNAIKRIVLITDGRQTDMVDTYAVNRAVAALQAADVKVDAIFLDDNITADTKEVQISGATFTGSAYKSHDESVDVSIQSTGTTQAIVGLYRVEGETERLISETVPTLSAGANLVNFKLDTTQAGTFDYRVKVETEPKDNDTNSFNNTYSFTQTVSADMNILLLTGNWASMKVIIDRYKDYANIDVYENCADMTNQYEKEQYKAQVENPAAQDGSAPATKVTLNLSSNGTISVPVNIEKLCLYDVFIINDCDLSEYSSNFEERWEGHSSFLNGLETAVDNFGKTLITIGDLNVQNASRAPDDNNPDVEVSELEKLDGMLPVKFGKSAELPDLYTIVLDVSTSLRYGMRFDLAKKIATAAVDALIDENDVCVIQFDGESRQIQSPVNVGTNRDSVKSAINRLQFGTGTMITGGLDAALNRIHDTEDSYNGRQILLITDGVSTESQSSVAAKFDALYGAGVVTSVAWLGPQKLNTGAGGADKWEEGQINETGWRTLTSLNGHGVFSDFSDNVFADEIDGNVFGEMINEQLTYIIEGDNAVKISDKSSKVLQNISKTSVPNIGGFVLSYTKPGATNVLDVSYQKNGMDKQSPLYAYWKYGNGLAVSFTSRLEGEWISKWNANQIDEQGNPFNLLDRFMGNVFDASTPGEKTDYPYTFSVLQEEGATSIRVIPALQTNATRASARIKVTSPDGTVVEQTLAFDGYNYFYEFLSTDVGKYSIEVVYTHDQNEFKASAAVNVSYPSEYNDFATFDPSVLFKSVASNGRGTVSTDGTLKVENKANEVGTYTVDLTAVLLIVCAVMYVADIVIRKLKWADVVSFFGGFKKSKNMSAGGEKK